MMDWSKKYINMCEKAEEIQNLSVEKSDCRNCWADNPTKDNPANLTWLPRQDQLQEMVKHDGTYPDGELPNKLVRFFEFLFLGHKMDGCWSNGVNLSFFDIEDPLSNYAANFLTIEQLWLAFIMRKLYGKIWSDTQMDWVKGT